MTDKEIREAILRISKERHDAHALPLMTEQFIVALGAEPFDSQMWKRVRSAICYLSDKGFVRAQTLGSDFQGLKKHAVIQVTSAGIDELEHLDDPAPRRLHAFPLVVQIIKNAQFGDHNTMTIGAASHEVAELVEALRAIAEAASGDDDCREPKCSLRAPL